MEIELVNQTEGRLTVRNSQEIVEIADNVTSLASNRLSLVPMRRKKSTRPASCRLQLTTSPCVRKVSQHLELLSTAIQDILSSKRHQPERISRETANKQLQVIGVGQHLAVHKLEMEARVITDEVMGVVGRLEDDIADTESRLMSQKETAGNFKTVLHKLRRQQLLSLHSAVDIEHSSCTVDIQELEWHVNYEKRQVAGLEKRHRVALKLNFDLRKDIDFFEKSKPELAQKAENEGSMLTVIADEQSTAHFELEKRSVVLKDTEKKHETAIGKIREERSFIENDLRNVRKELADIKQAIVDARAEFDYMVEKKARSEELIKKNRLDKQLYELKSDNTRAAIRYQSEVNGDLSKKLEALMEEGRELETQLMSLTTDFDTQKSTWDDILAGMQRDLEALEEKHRMLHQDANDLEALVDDKNRELDALKKRKQELEANVKRMEKDIVKYEDQMLLIVGEIAKLEGLVFAAEAELKKLVAQNSEIERNKRATIENLKQQINTLKQEIQMLAAKYEADLQDLEEIKQHTEWKRQQFEKLIAEHNVTIAERTKKVVRMSQKNEEKLATVAKLEQNLSNLRAERAATEAFLETEASKSRQRIEELTARKLAQAAELRSMRFESEQIHKSLKELNDMVAAMLAASKRYDARLEQLEVIYEEARKQMSWRKQIEDEIQDRLVKNRTGMVNGADRHETNLNQRRLALKLVRQCLGANFYYNAYLVGKYRLKQNELNDARNRFANDAVNKSIQRMQSADSALTAKFLQLFESSNELSSSVRRAFCAVHQKNRDCECCRNVMDIRSVCVTLGAEAAKDGEEIVHICHVQSKLRDDNKFAEFKTVPFDMAKEMVADPPMPLSNKA